MTLFHFSSCLSTPINHSVDRVLLYYLRKQPRISATLAMVLIFDNDQFY